MITSTRKSRMGMAVFSDRGVSGGLGSRRHRGETDRGRPRTPPCGSPARRLTVSRGPSERIVTGTGLAMAVISFAQQKGGAGKTTLAVQLGVAWLLAGKRIAMLDIDPQASLFTWFNLRRRRLGDEAGGLVVQGLSGWRLG